MTKPNVKIMTTEQLWEMLQKVVADTAASIKRMAEIWVELQNRGEDLSAYRNPMLSFLPDVANGKLLPEVLLRYGGSPMVLQMVSSVVPEDQKKLVSRDARVSVLQVDGTARNVRLSDLRHAELRQVIGDGRIRTLSEQQRHLAPVPRTLGTRSGPVRPINSDWDLYAFLTPGQRKLLQTLADDAGMTPAEYVVDVIVRHKIIPGKPAVRATRALLTHEMHA